MLKIVTAAAWDFGEESSQLVKVCSRGLMGQDYKVLVKRAGEEFADSIKNTKFGKDQVPVHVIALGSTEGYGPNRNGDGFKEAALRKFHDTFVKHARWYRHHQNKDPSKSYGIIKASHYNERMRRVELLGLLNGSEKCAEENNGLLADKELELLHRGKDIPTSMACKVAFDVCAGCGNKARNRNEYCTEDTCRYGGCKDNITKVAEDGHINHVDNPEPDFFDNSTVIKNADRIAFGSQADYMAKSASDHVYGGAELAEMLGLVSPLHAALEGVSNSSVAEQIKLAYQLAAIEDTLDVQSEQVRSLARAFDPSLQPVIDPTYLGPVGSVKLATALGTLASHKAVLPVRDFVSLVVGGSSDKCAELSVKVASLMPGMYNRLIGTGSLAEDIRANPIVPSQDMAPVKQRWWAEKVAGVYSLDPDAVRRRCSLSAIRSLSSPVLHQQLEKSASVSSEAFEVARHYALYKLAVLSSQKAIDPLTYKMAIVQNYI